MNGPDTMLHWLGAAAKQLREQAGLMPVHVAAELSRDQSVIYRFEQSVGWPRDPESILNAYAAILGIDVREIWDLGMRLWWQKGQAPVRAEVSAAHRRRFEESFARQAPDRQRAQPGNGKGSRSSRSRRRAAPDG